MTTAQQKEIARLNKAISTLVINHMSLVESLHRDLASAREKIAEGSQENEETDHMATLEPLYKDFATARETIAGLSQENEELVREVQSLNDENSEIMSHLEAEVSKNDTLVLKINRLVEERHKFGIEEMVKLFSDENKLTKVISHLRQVYESDDMAKALAELGGLENISDSPETSKASVISIDHSSMSLYSNANSHFCRNSRMNSSTCSYSNTEIISNRNYSKASTEPSLMATENSTFDGNIIECGTYDFNSVNKDNAKEKDVENQDYQGNRGGMGHKIRDVLRRSIIMRNSDQLSTSKSRRPSCRSVSSNMTRLSFVSNIGHCANNGDGQLDKTSEVVKTNASCTSSRSVLLSSMTRRRSSRTVSTISSTNASRRMSLASNVSHPANDDDIHFETTSEAAKTINVVVTPSFSNLFDYDCVPPSGRGANDYNHLDFGCDNDSTSSKKVSKVIESSAGDSQELLVEFSDRRQTN